LFVVFGATSLSHLLSAGVPYPLALVLSALVMVPVGAVHGHPGHPPLGPVPGPGHPRPSGSWPRTCCSLTALAFGSDARIVITRPGFLAGDTAFYYFALAVVVIGIVAVETLRVSRLGRILTGLADSPTAMEVRWASTPLAARVLTFCVAAFLAAIAGGLLGTMVQVVNAHHLQLLPVAGVASPSWWPPAPPPSAGRWWRRWCW